MTWITLHWALLAAIFGPSLGILIATLASIYADPDNDPATPPPTRFGVFVLVVQRVFTAWAPPGYAGIAGTKLSIPLLHVPLLFSTKAGSSSTLKAIVFVLLATQLAACIPLSQCKDPLPAQVATCRFEKDMITCGERTGFNLIPIAIGIVVAVIAGNFDADLLINQLEAEGFKDIPCVLAALQAFLMPINPQAAIACHKALVRKLQRMGKRGQVDVKLLSGVVHVVIP